MCAPEAAKHRLEWGALPSVGTWNHLNTTSSFQPETQEQEQGAGAGAAAVRHAEGDGAGASAEGEARGRKRGGSELDGLVGGAKGGAQAGFSNTYDWSYRVRPLPAAPYAHSKSSTKPPVRASLERYRSEGRREGSCVVRLNRIRVLEQRVSVC